MRKQSPRTKIHRSSRAFRKREKKKASCKHKPKRLTLAEQGDIRETLAFEEIGESRGEVAAEAVPLEAELLLVRVHDATPRADPVTFATTPVVAALQYGIPLSIAPVPDCSSSCKIPKCRSISRLLRQLSLSLSLSLTHILIPWRRGIGLTFGVDATYGMCFAGYLICSN